MRRARLIVVALLVAGRAVCAQPVDPDGGGLSACLQAARAADDGCARLTDDPTERIACFQKARTAEFECLEHSLSDSPPGSAGQGTPAASASTPAPAQPSGAASPDITSVAEQPKLDPPASLPEPPIGSITANEPQERNQQAKDQQPGDQQGKDPDVAPPADPGSVRATEAPAASATASVEATQPREPDSTGGLRQSSWVVSETTSPVDYSPLISAVIRPASRLDDGPSSLSVRCRRGRTELSIWSEAGWRSTRSDALLVDHRVNKEPIVRLMWSLSADAKTATYKEDAIELLRSLPEGGLLSISIPDGDNRRREATFLLTGWTAIRQKIEKLCKWPPAGTAGYGKMLESSGRREPATAADSSSPSPAIPSAGPPQRAPAPHRRRP
jgi:hypothetical protein